ncbi:DUF397 domain-containing protein [Streptantibioticus silvisoli]|jgi:hypothetical protein|uniref:DUF397 domain-containing protein n=1 Tax=Streptantibioticus silvisoli TaxID=2705255 RepID=A0ABT6WAC6_9ACTN|nr:DUF397 domain-containing protein [Streptantibioticus silvisoli]MDI5966846.1 DUF397 domain-containing protein [Streptantibioticus silvisoli]
MNTLNLSDVTWRKSSHSNGDGGDCVEWAPEFALTGVVAVRDSKNPTGPVLAFPTEGWTAFVDAVAAGELGEV